MLRSSRYRSTNEPQPSELNPSTTVQSKRPPSLDIPQNRSDSRPSDMVQSKRPPPLPSAATLPRNAMASLMSEVRASGGRVSGEKPAVRKSVPPPLPVSALPGTINQQEKKKRGNVQKSWKLDASRFNHLLQLRSSPLLLLTQYPFHVRYLLHHLKQLLLLQMG